MKFTSAVDVVLALADAYFHLRDSNAAMECLTDDIIWVGMEEGEYYFGRDEVIAMLNEDIANHPAAYKTEMLNPPKVFSRADNWVTVVASGERRIDEEHCFTVRATADCVLTQNGWRINSLHTSVPNMAVEQFRLKMELTEEQRKQEMLMRGIPGGVAIYRLNCDGTVPTDYVSEGLAKSLGYTADEFLALLRKDARCNLVPEDVPGVMEKVMEGLKYNAPISVVYRVYNKQREPVRIRLDANIIEKKPRPGELAVLYAVHAIVSEAAEAALREQMLYRNLLDNMDIAYFESHADGSFYASERYYRYAASRVNPSELVNNSGPMETVHPDDIPILLRFFDEKKLKKNKISVTLRCRMTDGTYRWTEMMGIYEYAPDGHPVRQIGVFRDAENEWIEQNRRLTEALETARKAIQSKTEFFSRVSHDIRTPLNAILGFARIARDSPGRAPEYIAKILYSGEYLSGLIDDVLSMSAIENNLFTLHEDAADVRAFLIEIADMFEQTASQKGVRLVSDFSKTRSDPVLIDRLRLKQVYSNLLNNAIKFSAPGTTINWTVVHIPAKDGMDVVSTIRDEGCGMSEAFLSKLFQPFAQEPNPYSEKQPGTGLGLSIVKSLVDRMNGDIQVESRLGEGTTVTMRFHRLFAVTPASVPEKAPETENISLAGKRILLCEDHPLNREIAVYLLKSRGIIVEQAEDGLLGLEAFRASPVGWFDGILMDILMPEMDGMECTKRIRGLARPDAASIPIIAMTANAYEEDVKAAVDAGMNAHVAKPVDPEVLYATLSKWMSHAEASC
ncbi:MAG: ATP-binding protein [Clostridia bacterium]|nr:ATP-binding protein [Clostridia bacterium]